MDKIETKATSHVTAQVSDLVLRETSTTRLVFRPTIVDNPKVPAAAIKGVFLFQRKSKRHEWTDIDSVPFSTLKSGEGYKLELRSAELLELMRGVSPLYKLHQRAGVPRGKQTFVKLTPQLEQLRQLSTQDLSSLLKANESLGAELFKKFLEFAINSEDPGILRFVVGSTRPSSGPEVRPRNRRRE